jgi:DNA-binding transcriptional MerR regulator
VGSDSDVFSQVMTPRAGEAGPALPVASVARRLGVSPSTLRTWDRRYGIGPSRHTGGRHRRYDVADIGRLELMQRALLGGASTAEAARYALERMPKDDPSPLPVGKGDGPPPTAVLRVDTPDGAVMLPSEAHDGRPARFARRLSAAALALDVVAVQALLDDLLGTLDVLCAWEEVLEPVLAAFAGRRPGQAGSEVTCLLTEGVLAALLRVTRVPAEPHHERPVLLGCVPEERDTLPLYALAAALAGRGVSAQPFGTPLPPDALTTLVWRGMPAAVVLAAKRPAAADARLFTRISRGRQRCRLFAFGAGWSEGDLPARVELLDDVRAAADRVEHLLVGAAARGATD